MPWATDGSQDTVQFQKIYERFRHPECHEYLFERDGMSNTVTSNAYWKKLYVQAFDMYGQARARPEPGRHPRAVRRSEHRRRVGRDDVAPERRRRTTSNQYRPPVGAGAPGPLCPPELKGGDPEARRGSGRSSGSRAATRARPGAASTRVTYLWLRDGAPHPSYMGAPIGSKPECECDADTNDTYVIQPEDSGHWISVQVTAHNEEEDAATSVVTNAILVSEPRRAGRV